MLPACVGISLAVKKTTFRLREFNIVTKLSHKNICPILAIMVGGQHPVHKRRHLVYYFMPRLTGDCARMITDHQDLTMKALCKKYRNSPMDLGVVQGNLRYLIAEALRGIAYLHSLHIVHRDVKGMFSLISAHQVIVSAIAIYCSIACLGTNHVPKVLREELCGGTNARCFRTAENLMNT